MINYYELLEVNEKASKEIISKVFKLHIKKNHPDLFQGQEKIEAEEKIKLINEAYEVLSDDAKRKDFDYKLNLEKNNEIEELKEEIIFLKEELEKSYSSINSLGQSGYNMEQENEFDENKQVDNAFNRNYNNGFVDSVPTGYKEYYQYDKDSYQKPSIKDSYFRDVKAFLVKCALTLFSIILFWIVVWELLDINIFGVFFK